MNGGAKRHAGQNGGKQNGHANDKTETEQDQNRTDIFVAQVGGVARCFAGDPVFVSLWVHKSKYPPQSFQWYVH